MAVFARTAMAIVCVARLLDMARSAEFCPASAGNSSLDPTCLNLQLLQIGKAPTSRVKHGHKGPVLYVLRTWHKNYQTRLRTQLKTWARSLAGGSVLVVGDVASEDPLVHPATGCKNGHNRALTCKSAHALALAADEIGDRSWAFVIDDDVYVNTSNVEKALAGYNPSELIALGIPGCGAPHCDDGAGGFCGGGGYAVSKAALKAMVDKPTAKAFHEEALKVAEEIYPGETPWDDITMTCMLKRHGVATKLLQGLYGWRIPGAEAPSSKLAPAYRQAIASVDPVPLTFHYINEQEMSAIHDEFAKLGNGDSQGVSLLGIGGGTMSYEEQRKRFVARMTQREGHSMHTGEEW